MFKKNDLRYRICDCASAFYRCLAQTPADIAAAEAVCRTAAAEAAAAAGCMLLAQVLLPLLVLYWESLFLLLSR